MEGWILTYLMNGALHIINIMHYDIWEEKRDDDILVWYVII